MIVGNTYAPFFRVNSVFWDPSIYGRYLAVAILATLTGILLGGVVALEAGRALRRGRGDLVRPLPVLLAVELRRARKRCGRRGGRRLGQARGCRPGRARGARRGLEPRVSERPSRSRRARALRRERDHERAGQPRLPGCPHRRSTTRSSGVGVGGFKKAYAERTGLKGADPKKAASHTTPVTVAAEEGFPGLALLVWLVAGLARRDAARARPRLHVTRLARRRARPRRHRRAQPLLQRASSRTR